MDQPRTIPFCVGAWFVEPASCRISREGEVVRLDTRSMRLLQCLASRAGTVVSIDELLDQVWPGVIVTPDSVYQAVASLRRSLGDDPKHSIYIATVPRLGYRMVAEVRESSPVGGHVHAVTVMPPAKTKGRLAAFMHRRRHMLLAVAGVSALVLAVCIVTNPFDIGTPSPAAEMCVGVLPFLDMTDAMDEEPFADGMTEQVINDLSKIPGSHVPSLTASLYFKGKRTTIADVAKTLGVAYVLEGSVRKSGNTLRIAAELIRADDGYVIWSNTYDRPTKDVLAIQSDIAAQVKHALEASLRPSSTVKTG